MKSIVFWAFMLLAAGAAVYIFTSLRKVGIESIENKDLPSGFFKITGWISDAGGTAYIMIDPSGHIPVTIGRGLGTLEEKGIRTLDDCAGGLPAKARAYRITAKGDGRTAAFVLAAERLEFEAGYNILKKTVSLSFKDPMDSHHRRMHDGP